VREHREPVALARRRTHPGDGGSPRSRGARRILAQMLTESVLLGICGGGLGVLFAMWTADALPSFFPAEQSAMLDARIDMRALGFTLAVAVASSLLFGMAPAFQALRTPLADALRTAKGMTSSKSGIRIRTALVVAQIALATVLLVSAGLLVRSLLNALQADLGFATREAVVVSLEQPVDRGEAQGFAYYRSVVERTQSLPGIASVSLARTIPLFGAGRRGFRPDGYEFRTGESRELHYNVVSSGFFETMQIPLLAGRPFDNRDGETPADRHRQRHAFKSKLRRRGGRPAHHGLARHRLTIVGVVRTQSTCRSRSSRCRCVLPAAAGGARQLALIARTSAGGRHGGRRPPRRRRRRSQRRRVCARCSSRASAKRSQPIASQPR
jgi:hypothetical protein